MRRGAVCGVQIAGIKCSSNCIAGEAHRVPIPKTRFTLRANGILDLEHSDLCGPIEVDSIGGARYFITSIDSCSNWVFVHPTKRKSEAALSNF